MTRTAGAPIGCQRPSRFWGLGRPKIYHEAEDTLVSDFRISMQIGCFLKYEWGLSVDSPLFAAFQAQ
ncbi:hypothetical protein [Thiolapillus sp.]|uniref:hypothetical protein n=1 Tax=Thiolapillus sp. TaxID=2017437 RepID=UPI0025F1C347|nr:hypothetical protein [Thiolapillus sp.]